VSADLSVGRGSAERSDPLLTVFYLADHIMKTSRSWWRIIGAFIES